MLTLKRGWGSLEIRGGEGRRKRGKEKKVSWGEEKKKEEERKRKKSEYLNFRYCDS
jgi:hypothetical protein